MTMSIGHRESIFRDIANERTSQDQKWGAVPRSMSAPKYLAILMEEVGEAAEAIIDTKNFTLNDLRKELIQVAAVAVCFIEELDHITT